MTRNIVELVKYVEKLDDVEYDLFIKMFKKYDYDLYSEYFMFVCDVVEYDDVELE